MHRRGFTLLELLITITIVVILAIVGFLTLSGRNTADLSSETQQVGTLLREAESRSLAQASDTMWGVYFSNATTTAPFFALFSGSTYSATSAIDHYPLPTDVCYSTADIPVGSSAQVTFNPITGIPSSPLTVVLDLVSAGCSGNNVSLPSAQWSTTTPMPQGADGEGGVIYNGYAYVVGGRGADGDIASAYYAPVNGDGSFGSWQDTTPLPEPIGYAYQSVANGNYYIAGGFSPDGSTPAVLSAPIEANGALGDWQDIGSLPNGDCTLISFNEEYIYCYEPQIPAISYASIGADSVGTWQTTNAPWPPTLYPFMAFNNNFAYVFGGGGGDGMSPSEAVSYAPVNGDGSLGTWETTSPFIDQYDYLTGEFFAGNYVYKVAGQSALDGSPPTTATYYAPVNATGSLGTWKQGSSMPLAASGPETVYDDYFYSFGGSTGNGGFTSAVYYIPFGGDSIINISNQGVISY